MYLSTPVIHCRQTMAYVGPKKMEQVSETIIAVRAHDS